MKNYKKKITKKEYEDALIVVENYLNQIQGETYSNEAKDNLKKHAALMGISKNSILIDVGSVRLLNILKINEEYHNVKINHLTKIEELSKISLTKFKSFRSVGRTVLWELKAICYYSQIKLRP